VAAVDQIITPPDMYYSGFRLMPSAQRNETEIKQFQNCFETVLSQFHVSFISLRGRHECLGFNVMVRHSKLIMSSF